MVCDVAQNRSHAFISQPVVALLCAAMGTSIGITCLRRRSAGDGGVTALPPALPPSANLTQAVAVDGRAGSEPAEPLELMTRDEMSQFLDSALPDVDSVGGSWPWYPDVGTTAWSHECASNSSTGLPDVGTTAWSPECASNSSTGLPPLCASLSPTRAAGARRNRDEAGWGAQSTSLDRLHTTAGPSPRNKPRGYSASFDDTEGAE